MKKLLLASAIAATSLFALSDAEIKELYSNLPQGLTLEIAERSAVKEFPGVDRVLINITDGKMSQSEVIFTKDNFIIQDLYDAKNHVSLKQDYLDSLVNVKVAEIYKKEDPKNIIKLGNDEKKPTTIVFSDPRCPHCQNAVANIETLLKDSNVELISLSFIGGPDSMARNAKMYEEVNAEKDEAKKIAIVKKYYANETKVPEASADAQKAMMELSAKYSNAGINSVPKFIEKADLNLK